MKSNSPDLHHCWLPDGGEWGWGRWSVALVGLLIVIASMVFLAITMASAAACTHYNPSLFPSYDVLNPGPEVRKNPLSATEDPATHESLFIVNSAFLQWVAELKAEVLKLRKGK